MKDPNKFFRFHNDVGHHTKEGRQLKDEIENLIKLGNFHQYARGGSASATGSSLGIGRSAHPFSNSPRKERLQLLATGRSYWTLSFVLP